MCADDAPYAERLLDWIYELNGKSQRGHILLVYAHDTHQEIRTKCRICAELAFESVSEFTASSRSLSSEVSKPIELKTKTEFTNNLWNQAAHHIAGHYRWPWLWLEPDCVPLTPDWVSRLAEAYQSQPRKFMGRKMKRGAENAEHFFMSRIAIYPTSAYTELRGFVGSPPLEWAAGNHILPRGTSSKLIQMGAYDGNFDSIPKEAVLYHSDKGGKLVEQLREKGVANAPHENGEIIEIKNVQATNPTTPMLHVRQPEVAADHEPDQFGHTFTNPQSVTITAFRQADPEPRDRRTKEWREWSKRKKAEVKQ